MEAFPEYDWSAVDSELFEDKGFPFGIRKRGFEICILPIYIGGKEIDTSMLLKLEYTDNFSYNDKFDKKKNDQTAGNIIITREGGYTV